MSNIEAGATESVGFLGSLWKKFLVYPTIFTALIGATPTALDLYKANQYGMGVENFRNVAQAEEQRELWKKNFFCSSKAKLTSIQASKGVTVNVLACPSGDVLTTVIEKKGSAVSKWITVKEIQKASLASVFITAAHAQSTSTKPANGEFQVAQATNTVMCQAWSKPGEEVNRVVSKDGKCYLEKVNVLTGKTLETKEVTCSTKCE